MKMAKKVLAVLLSVLFVVGVFTACSSNGGDTKKKEDTTNSATSKLKVGFIFLHDKNSTYDLNFIKGRGRRLREAGHHRRAEAVQDPDPGGSGSL